uniref:SDR family NAD(P)-dependent oxidoreductase n=1 Tax=Streptomyces sp. NBC_01401 TaxID=2903854 RepID=A0AAU3GMU3_9ACTN
MTTFALVGAGAGLGLAAARRFGKAGHRVALLSRSAQHQDNLAAELAREDIDARGFTADVLDPASLTAALREAADTLGPVEILQFSPVPRGDFMKPVLDTTAADLDAPLAFSVKGPLTCVNAVLPGMRELGRGTLLFVNGGSAVRPNPKVAGTSIAFAGESAYAAMLHTALADENIHTAQLIVPGAISPDSEHSSPEKLAELLYGLHTGRKGFRHYAEPMSDPQGGTP